MFGRYRPRSTWRAWPALAATLLIVAAGVAAASGVTALVMQAGGINRNAAPAVLGWMAASQIVMAGLAVLAARSGGLPARDALALGAPARGLKDYLVCVGAMAGLLIGLNGLLAFGWGIDVLADLRAVSGIVRHDGWWLGLIVVGVGAPVSEELLFRGFLLAAIARSPLGFAGAVLITTGLWTALHAGYSAIGIAEVFLIGLLFAWMLARTGSLRVPLVCHGLYNTVLGLYLLVGPSAH
jgi:hypothetical protein